MALDFDTCYRAVLARDARFDGRFFTGVTSTGIYCRPICPARTPARHNIRFFPHAAAAEAAGFRACRRCRPEASPGSPDWNIRAGVAARAVQLIADGFVDEHGVGGLARALAVTDRHLRRLLLAELGATPLALARATRLQTARRLLAETSLPVTDVAFASGFTSVRQFNASFRQAYGRPPSQLRTSPRAREPAATRNGPGPRDPGGPDGAHRAGELDEAGRAQFPDGAPITLRLAVRLPFDGGPLLRFLAARAIPGVEQVAGGTYARTIHAPGGPGVIELTLPPAGGGPGGRADGRQGHVLLRIALTGVGGVGQVVSRCRQLLDLDADPGSVARVLATDEALAPLVAARPGLRVPGAYDGFELAVRAVLGQQVSVAAARTFAGRLAAAFGSRLFPALPALPGPPAAPAPSPAAVEASTRTAAPRPAPAPPGAPAVLFPRAADLAEADLSGLGLTTARQDTLRSLAAATATGRLILGPGADPEETAARLAELPGIGPWTVAYVLMRAVRDPDAFPATDLGLRRALARLGCARDAPARWRPWRAYAAMHLWTWYADAAEAPPTTKE